MKIHKIAVRYIRIPLRIRFSQSNNTTQASSSVILEIQTAEGHYGYGECCPRSYVTGESPQSVAADITGISQLLRKQDFSSVSEIQTFLAEQLSLIIGLSSLCAVELALLDAWGKENETNLVQELAGNQHIAVHYSGVIPMADEKGTRKILSQLKRFDFKDLKLKVSKDLADSLEKISIIKEELGQDISLRIDANNSWEYEDAMKQIPAMLEQGIHTFEQVLPPAKLEEMRRVTESFGNEADIMADESITNFASLEFLLQHKVCNYFNLKISKNGGVFQSLKLYTKIQQAGLSCQLGAHFGETSILSAAGLLFSSLAPNISRHEGAYGTHLLEGDICETPIMFDHAAQVDGYFQGKRYGLGVVVEKCKLGGYGEYF